MRIADFQKRIEEIYFERDRARGLAGTHMWFCEEVGELTRALRRMQPDERMNPGGRMQPDERTKPGGSKSELEGEFADVLAWLATLASIAGVDLEGAATKKYAGGCPRCSAAPCRCA